MRPRHVATTLAAITVGLTAATALHRRAGGRLPASTTPAAPTVDPVRNDMVRNDMVRNDMVRNDMVRPGVVLPFVRPVAPPTVQQPTAPARCGDSGGRTKAGAPCAARAADGGRCHHHRIAA